MCVVTRPGWGLGTLLATGSDPPPKARGASKLTTSGGGSASAASNSASSLPNRVVEWYLKGFRIGRGGER
jgi:hypothetical protein